LDKINGVEDPLEEGELGKILAVKQSLADAISATVKPILSTSPTDSSTIAAAVETMKQQLLNTLGPAFAAGAVVVFGLDQVSGADGDDPAGPPSLYGQPAKVASDSNATEDSNQNYTLTPARIPLAATANGDAPRLAFNFISKNVDAQAYVSLSMQYQITHMEFDRTTVPGIENYVESQWLIFINGPFDYALGEGTQYIPVLNRALPVPPTVKTQTATAANATSDTTTLTPADLATWDYGFDYTYPQAAQDAVNITITLNVPPPQTLYAASDEPDLFDTLANFITNYPAISADLDTYLVKINGQAVDQTTVDKATQAVTAFQDLISQVSTAYAAQFSNALMQSAGAEDVTVPIVFDALLEDDGAGNALYALRDVTIAGIAATYQSQNQTISNGAITLPAPIMEILPEQYKATPVNPPPTGATLAYRYVASDGSVLSFTNALAEPERDVTLLELNVMVYKNAQASLFAQRNKYLVPDFQIETVQTMPEFLYQTPVVKFTDPILPRITWPSYSLRQVQPIGGTDVNAYMAGFFNSLFQGATGQLKLSMTGSYSYNLVAALATMPRTYLPINLLPATEITLDAANPPAAAMALTQQVADWYTQNQPTTGGDAAMDFGLKFFSNLSSEQLLLSVDDLYWEVLK
ncbi:MAG TPA: hypothetical protein VM532_18235, partial [Burkholderiales bacterium]|nr:hypothetical protein [Burkholderiales bacterium]